MENSEFMYGLVSLPMKKSVSRLEPRAQDLDAGQGAEAKEVASAVIATWQEIEDVLAPVIGQRGVAALYQRSLYLTGTAYPWMTTSFKGGQTPMDLDALHRLLSLQTHANAMAGGCHLLHAFNGLLTSLVGPLLTERLLRSVWANSFCGVPALDNTP